MGIARDKMIKFVKAVIYSAMAVILIFLFWQKIVPAGEIEYKYNFSDNPKFIFGFYPEGRVVYNYETQSVINEPVYLDVYSPRKFNRAAVDLRYKNLNNSSAQFGVKLADAEWAFYFIPLTAGGDNFLWQSFEFDLSHAERVKNKIRFALSAPSLVENGKEIEIDEIVVKLKK